MTIGFFHIDGGLIPSDYGYLGARALVQSAKRCMPLVKVVQFTDLTSRVVKGVDAVRRKPSEPMGLLRMRHCAGVEGEWLFCDTDILFQRTVRPVFKASFDIGLTTRDWSHLKPAGGFSERMPFNTGVVFSRCPHFWGEVYTRLRQLDPEKQHFMGEQEMICEVAAEGRYHVRAVPGSVYNFPPELPGAAATAAEREANAAILHFKGEGRKVMLVDRLKREAKQCA